MIEEKDIQTFVLDDDRDDNELLRAELDKEGVPNVYLYTTIGEVKEKLNPFVRVVVIDIRLKEMGNETGADVLKHCRKVNPGCYVIIVSGRATEEIFIDLINNQADYFIKKKDYHRHLPEVVEQIKIGVQKVAKRDALLARALESLNRIEEKHKQRDDNGPAD